MKEKLYTIPVNDAFASSCECPICTMYKTLEDNSIEYTMGPSYMEDDVVRRGIAELEEKFAQDGRVLIRTSGTEPLVRVMIEGTDIKKMDAEARKLAALIEERLQ